MSLDPSFSSLKPQLLALGSQALFVTLRNLRNSRLKKKPFLRVWSHPTTLSRVRKRMGLSSGWSNGTGHMGEKRVEKGSHIDEK